MTQINNDDSPIIEMRSAVLSSIARGSRALSFNHLDVRTHLPHGLACVSTMLPEDAAASQNASTRARQTHRVSRLDEESHAALGRFTGEGL